LKLSSRKARDAALAAVAEDGKSCGCLPGGLLLPGPFSKDPGGAGAVVEAAEDDLLGAPRACCASSASPMPMRSASRGGVSGVPSGTRPFSEGAGWRTAAARCPVP